VLAVVECKTLLGWQPHCQPSRAKDRGLDTGLKNETESLSSLITGSAAPRGELFNKLTADKRGRLKASAKSRKAQGLMTLNAH
jgi:hypothetical protein